MSGLRIALVVTTAIGAGSVAAVGASSWWLARMAGAEVFHAPADVPPREVGIVPGASVFASGRPSGVVEDRLGAMLALYRAGKVRKILLSGDHATKGYDEVNAMFAWMMREGVPVQDLFLDHAGLRTLDTMERAARVFGVKSAVVSTQAYHLPRALFLARRAGIDAVGVTADRRFSVGLRDRLREGLAGVLALIDSYVMKRGARHLGPPIPIEGDGRVTHDEKTEAPCKELPRTEVMNR